MTDPTQPLPSTVPGYTLRTAAFWTWIHIRRRLRRRGFQTAFVIFGVVFPFLQLSSLITADADGPILLGLVPLAALFAGAGALRNEIEDQTLTYSFARPLGRPWIYRSLVVSAMAPAALITLPACISIVYHSGWAAQGAYLGAALLSIVSYTSVFALIGQFTKRATAFGCVYLFFWEGMVSIVPGFLGKLTLVTHVRTVAGLPAKAIPMPAEYFDPATPMGSALTLVGVTLVAGYLGGVVIGRREHGSPE